MSAINLKLLPSLEPPNSPSPSKMGSLSTNYTTERFAFSHSHLVHNHYKSKKKKHAHSFLHRHAQKKKHSQKAIWQQQRIPTRIYIRVCRVPCTCIYIHACFAPTYTCCAPILSGVLQVPLYSYHKKTLKKKSREKCTRGTCDLPPSWAHPILLPRSSGFLHSQASMTPPPPPKKNNNNNVSTCFEFRQRTVAARAFLPTPPLALPRYLPHSAFTPDWRRTVTPRTQHRTKRFPTHLFHLPDSCKSRRSSFSRDWAGSTTIVIRLG